MDKTAITFSDIQIDDQYSDINSRSKDVDISTSLVGKNFKLMLPVISANMPDITEYKMAIEMYRNGGYGILHRFMSVEENVDQLKKAQETFCCGVSIGVKEEEKERFDKLYEAGAKVFCIDVAHGHCQQMKDMLKWTRSRAKDITIIAGNIATARAALDLAEWGADILKVGIGPGSVCRTRSNTGVGKPQFSALQEVHDVLKDILTVGIISDGGIQNAGDIPKALIYADAVMVGAVLAGTTETPGNVYAEPGTNLINRTWYKMYGGSASAENKRKNGQEGRFIEGEMKKIPFKGHAKYLLREIEDGIRSSFSYCGAHNIREYKEKVKWYMISDGGKRESKF